MSLKLKNKVRAGSEVDMEKLESEKLVKELGKVALGLQARALQAGSSQEKSEADRDGLRIWKIRGQVPSDMVNGCSYSCQSETPPPPSAVMFMSQYI